MRYTIPMRPEQLEKRIERIKQELLKIGPMRPGTLSRQYAACQKPGCACVQPAKAEEARTVLSAQLQPPG